MRALSFSVAMLGLFAGCSNARPAATDDGSTYAGAAVDRCSTEGQTRECNFVIIEYPEYRDCITGTQRCGPNLRWGACERPDFVAPSSSSSSSSPSSSDAAPATFAGAPDSDDDACPVAPPALDAPVIDVIAVAGERPAAEGGRIVPGAYVLTRSEIFASDLPAGPTGSVLQRAAVVTEDHLAFSEGSGSASSGIDENDEQVLWFGTNGTAFGYEPTCPRRKQQVAIEYTAQGNDLVLFPNARQRDVLTRKP